MHSHTHAHSTYSCFIAHIAGRVSVGDTKTMPNIPGLAADKHCLGLKTIRLDAMNLWAGIRDVDSDFIDRLYKAMKHGWTVGSLIVVVELGCEKGVMRYGVVDGAHRVTTAKRLIVDKVFAADTAVPCRVFRHSTPRDFLLAQAMFSNDGQDSCQKNVTFFARLWWVYAMAKVTMERLGDTKQLTHMLIADHAGNTDHYYYYYYYYCFVSYGYVYDYYCCYNSSF